MGSRMSDALTITAEIYIASGPKRNVRLTPNIEFASD